MAWTAPPRPKHCDSLTTNFDEDTPPVRKIIDWSDLDLHHTLPSSCAVSYLRLIHALTGAASSGLGSFASAS